MANQKRSNVRSNAGRLGCLLPVAVIGLMALDHFVLTRFYRPGQHAVRTTCIGPVDGVPKWANTCDKPLNFTYCLFAEGGREVCREETLAPGAGAIEIDDALRELGGGFVNMRRMACAEPFHVTREPHPNNGRLRDVCR